MVTFTKVSVTKGVGVVTFTKVSVTKGVGVVTFTKVSVTRGVGVWCVVCGCVGYVSFNNFDTALRAF